MTGILDKEIDSISNSANWSRTRSFNNFGKRAMIGAKSEDFEKSNHNENKKLQHKLLNK
jgi:hypothetical protein